jgi:hypothetical protein
MINPAKKKKGIVNIAGPLQLSHVIRFIYIEDPDSMTIQISVRV